jgi:hypothetical protein
MNQTGPYGLKARGPDHARRLIKTTSGPLATIYQCPFCKHHSIMRKGIRGVGRGYGLGMGGKLSAEMGAHIRASHPAELADAIAKGKTP